MPDLLNRSSRDKFWAYFRNSSMLTAFSFFILKWYHSQYCGVKLAARSLETKVCSLPIQTPTGRHVRDPRSYWACSYPWRLDLSKVNGVCWVPSWLFHSMPIGIHIRLLGRKGIVSLSSISQVWASCAMPPKKMDFCGASLVVQWLRICPARQGTLAWSLVWEDPTCFGATKSLSHSSEAHALDPTSHNYWSSSS